MIARLIDAIVRWLKRLFPPDAKLRARGGGPALDRHLDERNRRRPRSVP